MWAGWRIQKSEGNPNHDAEGRFASAPGGAGDKITFGYSGRTTEKTQAEKNRIADIMNSYGQKLRDIMSVDQRVALEAYQETAYRKINLGLRNPATGLDADTGQARAWARDINDIFTLDASALPITVGASRGINAEAMNAMFPGRVSVGATFGDAGFMSTSWNQNATNEFTGAGGGILKFDIPAGAKALIMPDQRSEGEILLPPNSALKVDSIEEHPNGSGLLIIHCTYLGTVNKS